MDRWQNGAAEAENFRQAAPLFCARKKKLKKCEKTVDKSAFVCYNKQVVRQGREQNLGVFPSGQWGQTVNLLLFSFGGSNPPAPTKRASA